MVRLYEEGLFATREQEFLLKAALLEGTDAINAWEEWKGNINFEGHLDNGSFRLLSLLYKNLQQNKVKDPLMSRLKGIYRMVWYENQKLFYDISKVLRYFHDANIQTMALKGAALTVLYYKNCGVRPMADIDILVLPSQAMLTINLLHRAGWRSTTAREDDLLYRHSMQFKDKSGNELNLHWHVLYESCRDDSDTDFWDGAVPIKINDVPTLALNPTDTLLHVIAHGVRWNPESPIRWIADAISVINSPDDEIDWMRLVRQTKKHRVVLRVKNALNYLTNTFQAQIPDSIIHDINTTPTSPMERLEFSRFVSNQQENSLLGGLPSIFVQYLRLTNGAGLLPKVVGVPRYFQYQLHAKSLRHLVIKLGSAGIKRTKKKILKQTMIVLSMVGYAELWFLSGCL